MGTVFLDLDVKLRLTFLEDNKEQQKGIFFLLREVSRLESVIKDYELGMRVLNDKIENNTFKTPEEFK